MKIPPRNTDAFVKKPDPAVRAILVYGPDYGLVQERSALIGRSVVADPNDPFNVAVLTGGILADDPARLADEANTISMMGGRRLIRVEEAADGLTTLLKSYLGNPSPDSLVLLMAGELGSRSSLRKLFETQPNAAAVACYAADISSLQTLIRQDVQAAGYTIDSDACAWLAQQLTGDHLMARSEIDKLTLYMANMPQGTRITLQDSQNSCGLGGDRSMDDFVFAVGGGNPDTALRTYRQMIDEGFPVISIQRAMQNHFRRLHYTRSLIASGLPPAEAMKQLNPPVFFKWDDAFRDQLSRWSAGALESILNRLAQLEADCKKTGAADETVTAQAILSLASQR